MPTDRPARRLGDIIENIGRIRKYTAGMDERALSADGKTMDAVERCFERITEAARKLGDRYDARYPGLELKRLRNFGSVLRHGYDGIQPALVLGFVREYLDPLEAMARTELAKLPPDETG